MDFKPTSKFAYVVGACYKYVPELCALLNSLHAVENRFDVHVIGIDLPDEFTSQFDKLYTTRRLEIGEGGLSSSYRPSCGYHVIHHGIQEDEIQAGRGVSEIVCRKRYWYAGEIGKQYQAMCVLDADMVFIRNPWQFFEIAAQTGFVLGASKEQNKVYDHEHHHVDGRWLIDPEFCNDKDLCNAPLFIDARKYEQALKDSWLWFIEHGFWAPDMDAMNIAFLHHHMYHMIVKLAGVQWLGTNEQMLKPYMKACKRSDGLLWTDSGLEIWSIHGHYYHEKWRTQQLLNRKGCIKGRLDGSEKAYGDAAGALDVLYRAFLDALNGVITVEHKDYRCG